MVAFSLIAPIRGANNGLDNRAVSLAHMRLALNPLAVWWRAGRPFVDIISVVKIPMDAYNYWSMAYIASSYPHIRSVFGDVPLANY